MKEFEGANGARIVINEADFKTVKRLRCCLAEELKKINIDIGNIKTLEELKNIGSTNPSKALDMIKNCILGLECSDSFNSVMSKCLEICTWDNIKITDELFDDRPEAREDYDKIRFEALKVNFAPFLRSLVGVA